MRLAQSKTPASSVRFSRLLTKRSGAGWWGEKRFGEDGAASSEWWKRAVFPNPPSSKGSGNFVAARKPGGGRKPVEDHDPEITRLLEQVMEESTVGDPMSPLKWNSKSTYQIQQTLARQGHPISEDTIQRRLRKLDYSLQANRKDKEGES